MSTQTKIQLSTFEKELINNSEWILTKNNIIKKVQQLFGAVQENISDYTNTSSKIFPDEVAAISPKISKGENYLGLPWLMLDFPRYFDKENIFAIRTLFWWGNFFSTTLHLSGKYKELYSKNIMNNYEELRKNEFYICVNEDQWHHHLENENYKPLKEFSVADLENHIGERTFIKLTKRLSLSHWDSAIQILSDEFVQITKWLN
jgi:hypothetical protein